MKINLPLLACVSAVCLTLAACGSDDDDSDNSGSRSSSSINSSTASSSSSSSGWELVWSDEFEGTAIDSEKWSHEVNCTGGGNNELQCYTAREENSYVAEGKLHIVARKEAFSGPAKNDDDPGYDSADTSNKRDYTSARLRSKNKGDWKYGRMEFHAQVPHGQGIWPAFWMLPTEWKYGIWPTSGELDIFEAVNLNTIYQSGERAGEINKQIHGTLHYGKLWPHNSYTGDEYTPENNVWEGFNTYAVEWEEGEIRWYLNDHHFATQTSDGWFAYYWAGQEQGFQMAEGAAPFDQLFHLIMNVAVGGNWPGNPNDETTFPQQMIVDYVRVYQCSVDSETGKGCATNVNPDIEPLPGVPAPEVKEFSLYKDGPGTFSFSVSGNTVTNTLTPAFYDNNITGNVVSNPADADGDNLMWEIMFNAQPGNAFLTSEDMAGVAGVETGFKFTGMEAYGQLTFDLWVEAIDPETELLIKLDSGWPNASFKSIEIPAVGEWTSVSVGFSDLLPNDIQPGAVNYQNITNPFVIEPKDGTAHVKLDNIRVTCLAPCSVDPVLAGVTSVLTETVDIYTGGEVGVNWDFGLGTWDDNSGHVTFAEVPDVDRGEVLDITFSSSAINGLAFIQSLSKKDGSAFVADGYLEFDIKVLSYGDNTTGLVVKAESGPSTGTGNYVITPAPAINVWQTVQINIADMIEHPTTNPAFDISAFNTPFVFLPAWDNQSGVHVQLDNIRWVKP